MNYGIFKVKGFFKHDDLTNEYGFHKGFQFLMSHATFRTSPLPFLPSFPKPFSPWNDFL